MLEIVLGEAVRAGFINIHKENSSLPVLGARWQCLAARTQETAINVITEKVRQPGRLDSKAIMEVFNRARGLWGN